MGINTEELIGYFSENISRLIAYFPTLITAFFILIIGHYGIKIFKRLINRKVKKGDFEPTLSKFLINILIWLLRVLLFVTFISKLGIETASFVAIIGAAGLAIGLSLQGSLSNFAGGILIILFKPFEVGDSIEAQGVAGTVLEIQIFVTKLLTSSNQTVFVPNGILSNGNIINHTIEDMRRAETFITVSSDSNLKIVKEILLEILKSNSKIIFDPNPTIDVVSLSETGIKLVIRFWSSQENFSKVNSEILEKIIVIFREKEISIKN